MSKFIIIQRVNEIELLRGIMDLHDLVLCDDEGEMKHFSSKGLAKKYLQENSSSGQIVKINLGSTYSAYER